MISKKTFITTIVVLVILFSTILVSFYFYHINKIQTIIKENDFTILNNEPTGLENVIVE